MRGERPSRHLLGTARCSDDPTTSVVDGFVRWHDVPNLFVFEGSAFVPRPRSTRRWPSPCSRCVRWNTGWRSPVTSRPQCKKERNDAGDL
ncbi:GMC oxidoreductase [Streptomyces sp. NPDC047971]|uniref:GMC oxidoreductase n=1 Tax=Streptomyces sp. NPDC047971 TaxID=3154499 RepID=UPI0033DC8074